MTATSAQGRRPRRYQIRRSSVIRRSDSQRSCSSGSGSESDNKGTALSMARRRQLWAGIRRPAESAWQTQHLLRRRVRHEPRP